MNAAAARSALSGIVRDFSLVLRASGARPSFAIFRSQRSLPAVYAPHFDIADSRQPSVSESSIERAPEGPFGGADKPRVARPASLSVNMRCTHCPERIYGVRRYFTAGRLPVLLLRYNYPLDEKSVAHPDRSAKGLFATPEEDELFSRMLKAAGLDAGDLFFQEFPACHFDPRSLPDDWNRRTRNCLEHVQATIREHGIRQVLATGAAAVLLFGDRAQHLADRGESVALDILDPPVSCLVFRSPAALLAMEKQRLSMERSLERFSDESALYAELKGRGTEFRKWADEALAKLPSVAAAAGREEGVRIVANIRLKSASSIQGQQGQSKHVQATAKSDADFERFQSAGLEGHGVLFRLQRLRENEAKVKRQILSALRKVKADATGGEGDPV